MTLKLRYVLAAFAATGLIFLAIHALKINKIKLVMKENIALMNHYIHALEAASSAEEIAEATRNYASEVRRFGTKLKDLKEKYPEILKQKEPPTLLKNTTQEFEDTIRKLMAATARVSAHRAHPQVKAANDDLIQAWIETK